MPAADDQVPVALDVAGAVYDRRLWPHGAPGPHLPRLEQVIRAWHTRTVAVSDLVLVAQRGLPQALGRDGDALLAQYGRVLEDDDAPNRLLELARDEGRHVLLRKHRESARRRHSWIRQRHELFHTWESGGGGVRIVPLPAHPPAPARPPGGRRSGAQELAAFRALGLDLNLPSHREILNTEWRCETDRCEYAEAHQGVLLVWPEVRDDRAVCPGCGEELDEVGPRRYTREVRVFVMEDRKDGKGPRERTLLMFPLEADVPVVLGRGPGVVNLAVEVAPPYIDRVSRSHLLLRLAAEGSVRVAWATDLGSTNGSRHAQRKSGSLGRPVDMTAKREYQFGFKDRIVLANRVWMEITDRKFVLPMHMPESGDPADIRPTATTTYTEPPSA
ncbi:FHA domain-containing protein [Frankia sp. CNm7]|uniref:FHA domain-containing protein n=1 Tax=Frankia nepalensis TaxID=1836974 RepID=A0A937R9Q5_9ACTN|nr:FHA domain-containing protein [Frankia nepalensis]MBL7502318.1 FHA domain-containing protein [Frankia nepalensis]MBL7516246.1 FHA domain-containing protein [Frankia nepalensis]MBL7520114.1 FHA domain-containing protein [Frankia nepalensis]MBL7625722.1 FHA domain-containing protein [Frankia nepalensis]